LGSIAKAEEAAYLGQMRFCLEAIPDDCKRLFVAYSGGLDSSVLLHLLLNQPGKRPLIAWHVNHGLVDNAGQMEQFCVEQARAFGLELRVDRLNLAGVDCNIEAEARRQRYALFEAQTLAGDCVLTAHHADDQAETFLLNALRGSGVAGLRGIARKRWLGQTLLLRPLLDFSRSQLEAYAQENEITWFNDPSNRDIRFDRNYLRSEVVPRLRQRWPEFQHAFAASCEIQVETRELLDEIAGRDYAAIRLSPVRGDSRLDLSRLLALSIARQKNLIRHWIEASGLPALPHARLHELLAQMQARGDAQPEIRMPEYSVRIYNRQLHLVRAEELRDCGGEFDFGRTERIEVDTLNLSLTRREIFQRLQIEDRAQTLTLKFRRPGEANPDNHRLKRLFQKHRVPPWERDRTAQVYLDGRLEGLLL